MKFCGTHFIFKVSTVTRKLEITFKRPLKIDTPIICKGKTNKKLSEKLYEGIAEIEDEEGIVSIAKIIFFEKESLKDQIIIFFDKS